MITFVGSLKQYDPPNGWVWRIFQKETGVPDKFLLYGTIHEATRPAAIHMLQQIVNEMPFLVNQLTITGFEQSDGFAEVAITLG